MTTKQGLFIASDTVTQGGDDTVAESELKTGLGVNQASGAYAWFIHMIEFALGTPSEIATWAAADSYVVAQITTKSESSIVGYDSDHLVDRVTLVKQADGTPASALIAPVELSKMYSSPLVVASDSLFIRVASAASALTWTCSYRIHYEVKKISVQDFYKLIRVQA